MPPLSVEQYSVAPSTTMPPAITIARGENRVTSRDDAAVPIAIAIGERDEADSRAQRAVAHDALHIDGEQYGHGEADPTNQEHGRERGQPVAIEEQVERHNGVLGRPLHHEKCRERGHGHQARSQSWWADSQPFSGPIAMPKTAAVQINVASTAPVASSFVRSFWVSDSIVRAR